MSILRFNDGMEFDLSGELRMELREDGWYVVGGNILKAINNKEEGEAYIKQLNNLLVFDFN